MVCRYGVAIPALILLLMGGMSAVGEAAGFDKLASASAAYRNDSPVKAIKASRKLVVRSASALVADQQTGQSLYQKQAEAVVPIASITKLMTAMVVLDAQPDLRETITIGSEDMETLRHSGSRLPVGTCLTREEVLLLALMSSENRAAHALGRIHPGGLKAFVAAMNAKAVSLGLADTRFEEPTGLSSGNVSSARDLARMVDAAYGYPLIREFTTRDKAMIRSGRHTLGFRNINRLIRNPSWQIGLSKTGFISEAGSCLVMQAQMAQRPVLIVLLDAQGKLTRFADADRIKQWLEGPPAQRKRKS
jgi:D-alanyl-D-alanine endopeptidase (penicillin-binding protein 7)